MTASPVFIATGSSTKKTAHAVNLPSGTTSWVADAVSMTCPLAARGWRQIHLLAGKPPKLPQILAILLCHSPFESEPPTSGKVGRLAEIRTCPAKALAGRIPAQQ
jgi:hypothetical protein